MGEGRLRWGGLVVFAGVVSWLLRPVQLLHQIGLIYRDRAGSMCAVRKLRIIRRGVSENVPCDALREREGGIIT